MRFPLDTLLMFISKGNYFSWTFTVRLVEKSFSDLSMVPLRLFLYSCQNLGGLLSGILWPYFLPPRPFLFENLCWDLVSAQQLLLIVGPCPRSVHHASHSFASPREPSCSGLCSSASWSADPSGTYKVPAPTPAARPGRRAWSCSALAAAAAPAGPWAHLLWAISGLLLFQSIRLLASRTDPENLTIGDLAHPLVFWVP